MAPRAQVDIFFTFRSPSPCLLTYRSYMRLCYALYTSYPPPPPIIRPAILNNKYNEIFCDF